MSYHGIPKIYPNLNPAAAIPVDREQIFHLRSFADNYRMSRGSEHGQYVPNSRFVFVTMPRGETLLHPRYRHPVLSEGKPVLYAGEASFNNGRLEWWSNGSGNYRPDANHAAQAGLPMDSFYAHDEILKGTHRQQQAKSPSITIPKIQLPAGIAQARFAAPRASAPQPRLPALVPGPARPGSILISSGYRHSSGTWHK
jgi:hypothetical protein